MPSLRKLIEKQKGFYKSIVSVFSPALQEPVYFNSDGFFHLLNESNRQPRTVSEKYLKLMCLTFAPKVIKNATTYTTRGSERKIKGNIKTILQHALVFEVERGKFMRVIVEKIGTGKTYFHSIMPHNNKSKNRLSKKRK